MKMPVLMAMFFFTRTLIALGTSPLSEKLQEAVKTSKYIQPIPEHHKETENEAENISFGEKDQKDSDKATSHGRRHKRNIGPEVSQSVKDESRKSMALTMFLVAEFIGAIIIFIRTLVAIVFHLARRKPPTEKGTTEKEERGWNNVSANNALQGSGSERNMIGEQKSSKNSDGRKSSVYDIITLKDHKDRKLKSCGSASSPKRETHSPDVKASPGQSGSPRRKVSSARDKSSSSPGRATSQHGRTLHQKVSFDHEKPSSPQRKTLVTGGKASPHHKVSSGASSSSRRKAGSSQGKASSGSLLQLLVSSPQSESSLPKSVTTSDATVSSTPSESSESCSPCGKLSTSHGKVSLSPHSPHGKASGSSLPHKATSSPSKAPYQQAPSDRHKSCSPRGKRFSACGKTHPENTPVRHGKATSPCRKTTPSHGKVKTEAPQPKVVGPTVENLTPERATLHRSSSDRFKYNSLRKSAKENSGLDSGDFVVKRNILEKSPEQEQESGSPQRLKLSQFLQELESRQHMDRSGLSRKSSKSKARSMLRLQPSENSVSQTSYSPSKLPRERGQSHSYPISTRGRSAIRLWSAQPAFFGRGKRCAHYEGSPEPKRTKPGVMDDGLVWRYSYPNGTKYAGSVHRRLNFMDHSPSDVR